MIYFFVPFHLDNEAKDLKFRNIKRLDHLVPVVITFSVLIYFCVFFHQFIQFIQLLAAAFCGNLSPSFHQTAIC